MLDHNNNFLSYRTSARLVPAALQIAREHRPDESADYGSKGKREQHQPNAPAERTDDILAAIAAVTLVTITSSLLALNGYIIS